MQWSTIRRKFGTNLFKKIQHRSGVEKIWSQGNHFAGGNFHHVAGHQTCRSQGRPQVEFCRSRHAWGVSLELMLAGEMQWAMQQMFRQYDLIADLLVPSEQMPEVEPQSEAAAKPARSEQPMFNLGE